MLGADPNPRPHDRTTAAGVGAQRVVSVADGSLRGSGYLISDRLVLTCAHVTVEVGQSVQVFPAGSARTFTARVVWRGTAGGRDDAALMQVVDPEWIAPVGRVPRWGRLVTDRPGISGHVQGFPEWAQPDGHADTWQVTGTINAGSRVVADQYVLSVDGQPPTGEGSPWAGLSGAGLFRGPLLVGVVLADVAGGGHGHLGAVPMSLLVRDPQVRQVLAAHGLADPVLEPVELRELAELSTVGGQSPAALLTAQAQTVGFRGRELILEQLLDWCAGDDGFAMWLWHAGGGQGKTRLAVELTRRLSAQRWATLWLRGDVTGSVLEVLAEVTVPLLVVVDYAETRTGQLAEVLRACTGHIGATPVRVLLLARTAGDWWSALCAGDRHTEHLFDTARTTLLPVLDPEPEARPGAYRQAVTDLAVALATLPAHRGHSWALIAARLTHDTTAAGSGPVSALTVQMTALADLLDTALPAGKAQDRTGRPVEDRLLDHEHRWWWATARAEHLFPEPLGKKTLVDALSTAMLFGADDHEHADTLLRLLPTLADQSRDRRDRVQAWIGRLYPPPVDDGDRRWGSLQPDRLAERVIGLHLQEHPRLPEPLLSAATAVQRSQLITVYTRAAAQPAFNRALDQPLTDLVLRHPHLLAGPAIDVTTQVEVPGPLVRALRQLTADPQTSIDDLTAMSDQLPTASHNLAEWAAEITQRLVDETRHRAATDPNTFLPNLAISLNNLSSRLGALGRREEGLAASEEATQVYGGLAAARPDAFLPDRAASLNNLANRLGELGRREEGLAASEEATQVYRQLAAARPDTFLPNLAMSLNNLSVRLGELGRREEGLAASEEATQVCRQLAAARPDTFLPDLAMSLSTLANRLGELGRREEGLAASEEATQVYRQLAAARPDTFLPNLAMSLNNFSNGLGQLGRHEEGLAAIEEAVTIRRLLAGVRPDAFLPNLAASLTNLSIRLSELGRREEGLAASEEATQVYRQLAAARPDTFLPNLAMSLNNLSVRLGELGRREEGLAASEEATQVYRQLAAARPDTFLPNLAMSLSTLSYGLGELGRQEEGLAAIEEATLVCRQLAAARPDAFLPDLATSLNNLSVRLGALGRREESLAAIEEATLVCRQLAAARPDAFLPDLATSLNNLSIRLGELGQREEGLTAIEEAVTIRRDLAARWFDVFQPDLDQSRAVLAWLKDLGAKG